ncbi:DUF4326 domain-containing protein [Streptomyces albireticuli]|uniref:DUF4326 domain-containing protein n=1 Tax=Streptomyces albireticuli TaxID=1940 RepID=A0A2A2D2C7_9ACTN|nr:DUF4326 domain-containing protein [Streptomyces albireticuli]MCD9194238.1 DUF4326 domain-containing protein [Streptomyces albireticuli]PAU46583.1 hypothetical protein CK936_23310 [Streptomyces albireticuli]
MTTRIQRRRDHGWRKPTGAVYVGRGTRWGNPSRVVWEPRTGSWQVECTGAGVIGIFAFEFTSEREARLAAVEAYRVHLKRHPELIDRARTELAGRDLMCWCKSTEPCHADVLLELAAGEAL